MKATEISTMPKAAKIIATAVGAVLAVSLMSGTAEAGSWHSSGVKGAYAQGLSSRKNGRSYVKGYVKDTACDNHQARLDIAFGGHLPARLERVYAKKCRAVTHFDFNSQHRPVLVQECIVNSVGGRCGRKITIIR